MRAYLPVPASPWETQAEVLLWEKKNEVNPVHEPTRHHAADVREI